MSEIRRWLEALGLGQYAEAFERNDIDADVLPEVTEQDLEKLGVTLGHRKKLLKVIHASSAADTGSTATASPALASSIKKTPSAEAERRQLTVMFCDLVGSTALSQTLDPEQLRDLMRAYQQACGAVIEKYDGHVAQYLGDGLMIYFGWPRAHEDDAERAVRASLEIIGEIKKVRAPQPLQARIGIGTGRVVVGETGAGDASVPKLAVGETPNLAARVQGLAAADEILIAESTRRLAGGSIACEDLGAHALKGITEPVHTWRVTGLARTEGRFTAARGFALTPFVGREEEIGMILRRWSLACEGEGQVMTLCGEPGIGKSRLLHELQARLAGSEHTMRRLQCSPFHTNSPLHPFAEQIEREAAFWLEDSADTKHDKLKTLVLARDKDPTTLMPLLAPVLSLDTGGRYAALNLSPQKQRDETLAALCEWVAGTVSGRPVLAIFEDVHWIDPTSQQTLDLIVPAVARRRVLLLIMHRPEYVPRWTGLGHLLPLTLTRLARRQAADLVARVTKGVSLPVEVLDHIIAKTDGVPLFAEELTKAIIESKLMVQSNGAYKLTGKLSDFAIPATLHDSLMARLDRHPDMREVAQTGACIGREFSRALLGAVSSMTQSLLDEALGQLVSSELVYAVGTPSDTRYMFKHALVQDAAYESLLHRRRCALHLAIAQTLAKTPGTEPSLLASHYTKAEAPNLAVPRWLEAARKALASAQHVESIAHIENGLALLGDIEPEQDRVHFEVSLHTCLALNYVATRSYGAPEVQTSYSRAEELLPHVKDDSVALPVLLGVGIFHWVRANFALSVRYFEDLLLRAQRAEDALMIFAARSELATIKLPIGKPAEGRRLVQALLRDYDPSTHGVLASVGGQDYAVLGAGLGSVAEAHLGFLDHARQTAARGIAIAEDLKHPFSIGMALALGTMTELDRRDFSAAAALARRCIQVSDEQGLPYWANYARVAVGLIKAREGGRDEGIAIIEKAIAHMEQLGSMQSTPYLRIFWAEAMLLAGRAEAVHETMLDNLALIEGSGQAWPAPMTHFMIGRSWLQRLRGNVVNAESAFWQSIEHARRQESRTVELRAASWIARLWQQAGRHKEAYNLLAPVYNWFTEGLDTADLTAARELLETLSIDRRARPS